EVLGEQPTAREQMLQEIEEQRAEAESEVAAIRNNPIAVAERHYEQDKNTLNNHGPFEGELQQVRESASRAAMMGTQRTWQKQGLTDVEYAAMQTYSGPAYKGVNARLRGSNWGPSK